MNVNVNKELLLKHRFWILLGIGVILLVIGMITLPSSIGNQVEKKAKDFDSAVRVLKGIKDTKNQDWVDKLTKQDGYIESRKNVVWEQAWNSQAYLYTWPEELQAKFSEHYRYFGDTIDPRDREQFGNYYETQLYNVIDLVQPLTPLGSGVVQFRGGWSKLTKLQRTFGDIPTNEQVWFSQEDLWVKRELLRIVRNTNDMVGRYQEVSLEAPAPKDKDKKDTQAPTPEAGSSKPQASPAPAAVASKQDQAAANSDAQAEAAASALPAAPEKPSDPFHKKYRNPFWEVELTMSRSDNAVYSVKGKIKNISKQKRPVGFVFKLYLDETNPDDDKAPYVLLPVDRLPLAVGESDEIKEQQVEDNVTIRGLYGLEQILTWRTGPVKRIERVELGYPSSRTAARKLEPGRWVTEARQKEAEAQGESNESPAGPRRLVEGFQTSATVSTDVSLDRYTDVTDQVRHMPVAMAVIMDESLIPDFVAAVSNSPLRIQVLQLYFNHTWEHIKPPIEEAEPSGDRSQTASTPAPVPRFNVPGLPKRFPGKGPMTGGGAVFPGKGLMTGGGVVGDPFGPGRPSNRGLGQIVQGQPTGYPGLPGSKFGRIGRGLGNVFAAPATEGEEDETKLVEVAVHGLASLYERYPPKPPAEETSTAAKQ
jgi:hypothetical protein